jgi:hypothetical protein
MRNQGGWRNPATPRQAGQIGLVCPICRFDNLAKSLCASMCIWEAYFDTLSEEMPMEWAKVEGRPALF